MHADKTGTQPEILKRKIRTADGLTINVVEAGNPQGPAILFVHGVSQSWKAWIKQMSDRLLVEKFRLIALDLRGHGASQGAHGATDADGRDLPPIVIDNYEGSDAEATARLWGADIAAAVTALDLSDITLVGWSYGGDVVLDYLFMSKGLGAARKVLIIACSPVAQLAGVRDGGVDHVFTAEVIEAIARTVSTDLPSASGPEHMPGRYQDGLLEFVKICFSNGTPDLAATPDEIVAIATDCSTTLANVRLSIIRRIFDHRSFVRDLPQHHRDHIKIITPMKDQALQAENIRDYWAPLGVEQELLENDGHFYFWTDPDRFRETLLQLAD